ncbi:MAG TPA: hypothetical protein VHD56_07255 [Tepidisphaeraceae bacterium]|nr:hypothetical protein [Tepidisphaeraceae bacterium]
MLSGCLGIGQSNDSKKLFSSTKVQSVNLNNPVSAALGSGPISIAAAKNESSSFQIQVSGIPQLDEKVAFTLRLQALNLQTARNVISTSNFSAYQILSMPVDLNRAGYVRQTGLSAETRLLPRALLPLPVNDGRINLSAARDPDNPTDPKARAGTKAVMLWIDLHIPPETPAGSYTGVCDLLATGEKAPVASLPVQLTVYDIVMPDERHLNMVGQIDWQNLTRLYPDRFEAVTPRLVNRTDPRYAQAIRTLDELTKLAQSHRVEAVFPALEPNVKWPGGRPPLVAWEDFDSVVGPWMRGDMFSDKVPLSYWPLPACEGLYNYDPKSQHEYWAQTATHFDQNDWLARCPVFMEKLTPGRASAMESVQMSGEAAGILGSHPRIRVSLPLEDDQIQFASSSSPDLIKAQDASRLVTANPGVIFSSPIQSWPSDTPRPQRWMRTDLTGLIPYVGAGGDERDVRLWAWLSFLPLPPPQLGVQYGPVTFIRWIGALPTNSAPAQPADPNELIWFYPGSWFGIDQPVPTVQLKWLRRAQQDYEYLSLLRQRGDVISALYMSRLIAKPVELQPGQAPDPTYGLMCGTADPKAWDQAIDLLARKILLREPGAPIDKDKDYRLNIETLLWSEPQERPVVMARSTDWAWESQGQQSWADLRLGIDIYNPSDSTPDENSLTWTSVPDQSGWQVHPQPLAIPALATYHVRRSALTARIDTSKLRKVDRRPIEITFINGFTRKTSKLHMVLPVAATDRREGMLNLDGTLTDWTTDDAIQDGPMVKMFNRPALQAQELQTASTPTQIFTGWADENFYLAFKASGLSQTPIKVVRNFVNYQFRRAWGEDLCQILIQPVYADNSVGPVLHVVCKPSGHWIERKVNPRQSTDWQAFEGTGFRYVATLDGSDWRGEVAIPWKVINEPGKPMPVMLRFNFTQHRQDTGESASWAGPADFGRDNDFMGVLVLREPQTPGTPRFAAR